HLSGGLTPLLVAAMLPFLSWRGVFVACGSVGFVWAMAWYRWFRDEPRDHPGVNTAEAELIESERRIAVHTHGGRRVSRALVAASMFTLSASWATCMDIGAEHTAVLGATMNTTGQIGSILCPTVTGWVVKEFLNWQVPLVIMGGLYVLSAILWLLVDPRKRLV